MCSVPTGSGGNPSYGASGNPSYGASVVCFAWDNTAQPPRWGAWILNGTTQGAARKRTWP